MNEQNASSLIQFRPVRPEDIELYKKYLPDSYSRGCEFSFANLFLWGRQNIAEIHGHIALFSQFNCRSVYPWPVGSGERKAVIDAIIEDARLRGIPCRITGLSPEARKTLEELYPGRFSFHCDEGSFDYVYSIDDLADLKGKKYHSKRNHLYRFYEAFPDWRCEPLSDDNLKDAIDMVEDWYKCRYEENPNSDYQMEQVAISKAFRHYKELEMDGLLLYGGGKVLAVTMGSRLYDGIMDVHFEKARPDAAIAYTAINCEFAKYIRDKYPDIEFLDREEDMGLEGLRKAKKSYKPHHMAEKCWAHLREEGYEY